MKTFKIYKHPNGAIETVKQGWSWPAFFFGMFWALAKKLWAIGVGTLIGSIAVGAIFAITLGEEVADLVINLLAVPLIVVFGVNGNRWRSANLTSRGYEEVHTADASNGEEAAAAYIKASQTPVKSAPLKNAA